MNSFSELGLDPKIVDILTKKGITEPTKIQDRAIPLALEGIDIIGTSQTGSGKTLAFSAAIIQDFPRDGKRRSLILTPTRELAQQISDSIKEFSAHNPLHVATVFGGVSYGPQEKNIARADVIVATPGRLLDHIQRKTISLKNIEMLILDEADRMLDMGFIDAVQQIIHECPEERQTLLFSATLSPDIESLCRKYMYEPEIITVGKQVDPTKLHQQYYNVDNKKKISLLVTLLKEERSGLVIVFCNTRRGVEFVSKNLKANDLEVTELHGGLTQNKRLKSLDAFQAKGGHILVCTDVAARGLDIKGVTHVYNFDIPGNKKEYVHRIGRTARAGEKGLGINLLSPRDHDNYSAILREYPSMKIQKMEMPQMQKVVIKSADGPSDRGGRRGPPRGRSQGGRGPRRSGGPQPRQRNRR